MRSAHTPGPWRVGDVGHTVFGPKRPDGALPPIIIAGDVRRREDARLMAAAPDLLAALRDLVRAYEDMAHDYLGYPSDVAVPVPEAARAAIRAATGDEVTP